MINNNFDVKAWGLTLIINKYLNLLQNQRIYHCGQKHFQKRITNPPLWQRLF